MPQIDDKSDIAKTRIYDIVLKIISHTDGRIDIESLTSFIKAYQSVANLQLGELWAIPIMLRLALIENIRRVSSRVAIDRIDKNLADYWAKLMLEKAENEPKNLLLVVADMARSNPPIVSAFVSELTRQLRGKGPGLALTLNWIEQQLSENGLTSSELINAENQKQAADQVSLSNSIGSLRLLGAMDWRDFVETHSEVEQILREDNAGVYGAMNFSTRDRYRHVVEDIAKKSKLTESEVARIAIKLMQENEAGVENDHRTSHVGYYLIDHGVTQTKKLAGMRIPFSERISQAYQNIKLLIYLFFIFFITAAISTGILIYSIESINNTWLLLVIIILLLICTSQLAIAVVNFITTIFIRPHLLPKMDFSREIPPDLRTIVVIPVMLVSAEETEKLLESLEICFLANRQENLHFGLITDFTDASQEMLAEDSELLNTAKTGIVELNRKYQRENEDLFFLFHRPRKWNARENIWMGYERKRGKLSDLNAVLRGMATNEFSHISGDQSVFPKIKYVITLDADTQLPIGAAWKLIGTMAHPLNQPVYNEDKRRVTKGYGILQPRVTPGLPGVTGSIYARMHGNEPGLDPYTKASSDVYQDLFSEGSFIGKGIYQVDMFRKVLDGKFPENSILSHDLLEGCYLRSGLVSDVQLFENYPSSYRADMARYSRWIRGDWQIFHWIFPFVRVIGKTRKRNPLSGLSRWKIIDNIRRSLVPVALTLLIIFGWIALSDSLFWTITVSGIIILPVIIASLWDAINKPKVVRLKNHIKNSVSSVAGIFKKTSFTLICLPYEAFSNGTAIMKTLWRMIITRKRLLEWRVSSSKELKSSTTLITSYTAMWIQPLMAVTLFIYFSIFFPVNVMIAGPVLLLWFLAPFVTWYVSRPLSKQAVILTEEQHIFLRKLALKNWSFFEYFVAADTNWLPPDNYQEQPVAIKANRTSPTNIGLSLLANISAMDFGYLTIASFVERTANTMNTLNKLDRYKGHFYNWYKTDSLETLHPKYISTVDSGNLIAHLMVLKQGLSSIPVQIIKKKNIFLGLRDTLLVLIGTVEEKEGYRFSSLKINMDLLCNEDALVYHDEALQINLLGEQFKEAIKNLNINSESETYWRIEMFKKQLSDAADFLEQIGLMEKSSTLDDILKSCTALQEKLPVYLPGNNTDTENTWLELFDKALSKSIVDSKKYLKTIELLVAKCDDFTNVEWDFLYDKGKNLFSIGYNVQEHQADNSYYVCWHRKPGCALL